MDPSRLPEQLLPVPGGVRCQYCGRGWRVHGGAALSAANLAFLCDHVDDHVRERFRRGRVSWQELWSRQRGLHQPGDGSPAS
jgi:hypothetical protein